MARRITQKQLDRLAQAVHYDGTIGEQAGDLMVCVLVHERGREKLNLRRTPVDPLQGLTPKGFAALSARLRELAQQVDDAAALREAGASQ